ncbi:MAG TPA: bacillithiol system redox-active protein YtxJ [Chryseolinea sp.]|nr:bacillithiol system redox-active protein YtxJ [Chryseolinea sp.]
MRWNALKSTDQVDEIREESKSNPVLIFKYSNRCSVSQLALDRLERKWSEEDTAGIKPYFLDLINFREISNRIAHQFEVEHESPQVIVIKDGRSVYDGSHFDIDYGDILQAAKAERIT